MPRFDPASLDLDIDPYTSFNPKCISRDHMPLIFAGVPDSLKVSARALLNDGWKIWAVRQSRGRCYFRAKVITIPVWVITDPRIGQKIWYIAHEMAHAYDECRHNHGPEFMEWLKKLCPPEHIHWELTYKPRNARSAGIGAFDPRILDL